jgi:nitrogen fixation protein NifQ
MLTADFSPKTVPAASESKFASYYRAAWLELYHDAWQHPNSLWLSHIFVAQRFGLGQLPSLLGLNQCQWLQLWRLHFPHSKLIQLQLYGQRVVEKGQLRQQLLELRHDEWQELVNLLLQHRRGIDQSEVWMAQIVAAGCLSEQHLWQDLGLSSRVMLKQLLRYNYPKLVAKNLQSMRWKRFFYKQLCEQGGAYVCRSPSCESCSTYQECFGHEE